MWQIACRSALTPHQQPRDTISSDQLRGQPGRGCQSRRCLSRQGGSACRGIFEDRSTISEADTATSFAAVQTGGAERGGHRRQPVQARAWNEHVCDLCTQGLATNCIGRFTGSRTRGESLLWDKGNPLFELSACKPPPSPRRTSSRCTRRRSPARSPRKCIRLLPAEAWREVHARQCSHTGQALGAQASESQPLDDVQLRMVQEARVDPKESQTQGADNGIVEPILCVDSSRMCIVQHAPQEQMLMPGLSRPAASEEGSQPRDILEQYLTVETHLQQLARCIDLRNGSWPRYWGVWPMASGSTIQALLRSEMLPRAIQPQ